MKQYESLGVETVDDMRGTGAEWWRLRWQTPEGQECEVIVCGSKENAEGMLASKVEHFNRRLGKDTDWFRRYNKRLYSGNRNA